MIDSIRKYRASKPNEINTFSILIPSWNNLEYVKNCIESIEKNSTFQHQIIVFVNDGNDGTLEYLTQKKNIDIAHAPQNIGICYALNSLRSLVCSQYIVYMNDDMYTLPKWDYFLLHEIEKLNTKAFMLSSTMIEPVETGNKCVLTADYGNNLQTFNEQKLLADQSNLLKADWRGSSWPPLIMHTETWDLVGGFSIEFSPGMYSDPDISIKLHRAGVRIFKGVGNSLVYHFGTKSTTRIKKNNGKKTFLQKWNITANYFYKNILQIGNPYSITNDFPKHNLFQKMKFIWYKIKFLFL